MTYHTKAIEMLKTHEGLRLKPYRCTAGRLTIGYGRNIQDNGITEEEALFMLTADMLIAEDELRGIFEGFEYFTVKRKAALIDMIFNLGKSRFLIFRNMIKAINNNDWDLAAGEAMDSLWAGQVGKRASTIAGMLKRG